MRILPNEMYGVVKLELYAYVQQKLVLHALLVRHVCFCRIIVLFRGYCSGASIYAGCVSLAQWSGQTGGSFGSAVY